MTAASAEASWTDLRPGTYVSWPCAGFPSTQHAKVDPAGRLHPVYAEDVPAGAPVVRGRWQGSRFVPDEGGAR